MERKKFSKKVVLTGLICAVLAVVLWRMPVQAATDGMPVKPVTEKLQNNVWKTITDKGQQKFQIVVPKNGYIKVQLKALEQAKEFDMGILSLSDKDTRVLCMEITNINEQAGTAYFGLKKGTYFLDTANAGKGYRIRYSFRSVKNNSGSTQKKAVTLKKGRTAEGLTVLGDGGMKTGWYKIKLTKAQKIVLSCQGFKSGILTGLKLDLLDARGKVIRSGFPTSRMSKVSTERLPAGNYYVRIYPFRSSMDMSAYYTIRWNK